MGVFLYFFDGPFLFFTVMFRNTNVPQLCEVPYATAASAVAKAALLQAYPRRAFRSAAITIYADHCRFYFAGNFKGPLFVTAKNHASQAEPRVIT